MTITIIIGKQIHINNYNYVDINLLNIELTLIIAFNCIKIIICQKNITINKYTY